MRLSYENRVVLILTLVGSMSATDIFAFNFLSPFVASDLHLGNGQIGIVTAASQAAWAIGGVCTALWSDRIGRRRIFLVAALIGFAAFSSLTALAASFLALVGARTLLGLAEGPVVPMQNTVMHAASTPSRRGLNMGIAQNFGSQLVAGLAAPLILVGVATRYGWHAAFLLAGAPALLLAGAVHWGIREPERTVPALPAAPIWPTITRLAAVRNIRMCFVVGAFAAAWWGTLTAFIPLRLVRDLHFSPAQMGGAMACLGPSGAIAAILVPALSDRFGRRPLLVIFALVGLILPLALLFGPHTPIAVGAAIFAGCFFTGIFPLFMGIVPMESVEARHGATALAILFGCVQIASSLIGPFLGGALADRFSLRAAFWLCVGLALATAFAALFLTETAPAKATPRARPLDPAVAQRSQAR